MYRIVVKVGDTTFKPIVCKRCLGLLTDFLLDKFEPSYWTSIK